MPAEIEVFRQRYLAYPDAELETIVQEAKYVPAALEAAAQLLRERRASSTKADDGAIQKDGLDRSLFLSKRGCTTIIANCLNQRYFHSSPNGSSSPSAGWRFTSISAVACSGSADGCGASMIQFTKHCITFVNNPVYLCSDLCLLHRRWGPRKILGGLPPGYFYFRTKPRRAISPQSYKTRTFGA